MGDREPQPTSEDIAILETIIDCFRPLSRVLESKATRYPAPGEFEEQFIDSLYDALTSFHKQILKVEPLIRNRNKDLWKSIFQTMGKFSNSECFVNTLSEVRSLKRAINEKRELTPKEDRWMVTMINRLPQLTYELVSIVQQLEGEKNEWLTSCQEVSENRRHYTDGN